MDGRSRTVAVLCVLALPALAQSPLETRAALSITDEAGYAAGLRIPGPRTGNLLLVQPALAVRHGQRWRFSSSAAAVVTTRGGTDARFSWKETWFGLTLGDFDLSAGRKILRWGTGYAFTPTGVLDPPRDATDPADRLNRNEGRQMATADYVRGRHAVTAAWARQTQALRYNAMFAGFDTSVVVARDRGRRSFTGANFTRVFGEAVEVHGEIAHRNATAILAGGKFTPHSGVNTIAEFFWDGERRRRYGFLHVGKSRLRESPGWKEWDLSASLVCNLTDRSRVAILDAGRRVGNHLYFTARAELPSGRKARSEYGMIPYAALVSGGFRLHL